MNDFQRGYICAISCIVKGHGASTLTDEALLALGKINWDEMEPYDREVFLEAGMQPPALTPAPARGEER